MKRRLEDADDGFLQNPTKMMSTERGTHTGSAVYPMTGQPNLTIKPHIYDGDCRLMTSASQRKTNVDFESNPATEIELRHVIDNFVNIYEQLDKSDNPNVKPNYSYSELAYLAMLRSPNFCLPIGQIYSYIQSRFKFFRNSTRKHWKNAVRHSLAKTMCFSKIPVGRGTSSNENLARSTYLWCILPSSIACFARGDYRATIDKESGTNTLRTAYFRMNSEPFWNSVGDYIAVKMACFKRTLETSPNPGLMFESQTCLFPWMQQKIQGVAKSFGRREVFENVQNLQHVESNRRQINYGLTSDTTIHPVSSTEIEPPPEQFQTFSSLQMYYAQAHSSSPVLQAHSSSPVLQARSSSPVLQAHSSSPVLQAHSSSPVLQAHSSSPVLQAHSSSPVLQAHSSSPVLQAHSSSPVLQARSSSPVLRISETQSDNHVSFGERSTTLNSPDPWLSGFKVNSSETSFGSTELDQRTFSHTSFDFTDSGFADSVASENSCQFLNGCENQNRKKVLASPAYEHFGGVQVSKDEYEFTQFDLSPFTLSDFSDLHENMNYSKITPEKRPVSPALPPITACIGQPMYISTPVNNQEPRSKPCRYMNQPLTQSYDPNFISATPMFLVSADGFFSTAVLPNWIAYP